MNEKTRATVVGERCSRNHEADLFEMRFEGSGSETWTADWAFVIPDAAARRERYDQEEITGEFGFATQYLDCPHCEAANIFRCRCGKVAGCPWCRQTIELKGVIETLEIEGDR